MAGARRPFWIVVLCLAGSVHGARGASPPSPFTWAGTARLGIGYDSNVYRESSSGRTGTMFPHEARLLCEITPSIRSRLSGAIHGIGAAYQASLSGGSTREMGFSLGIEHRLWGRDRRFVRSGSIDISLKASGDERRRTYFSRTAGEEYAVVVQGDTISLARRYNNREGNLQGALTLRWPRSTQWTLQGDVARRDYISDYADLPGVDPLDYDETGWSARIRHGLPLGLRLDLSYGRSRMDYDSLTARDLDGNLMRGHIQSFRYSATGAAIQTRDLRWGHFRIETERKVRTDPFMGYYDYDQWSFGANIVWSVGSRLSIAAEPTYLHREYKRARVGYNPVRPLRDDFDRTLSLDTTYRLSRRQSLLLHAARESTTERNPAYTYARFRGWLGYGITLQ